MALGQWIRSRGAHRQWYRPHFRPGLLRRAHQQAEALMCSQALALLAQPLTPPYPWTAPPDFHTSDQQPLLTIERRPVPLLEALERLDPLEYPTLYFLGQQERAAHSAAPAPPVAARSGQAVEEP